MRTRNATFLQEKDVVGQGLRKEKINDFSEAGTLPDVTTDGSLLRVIECV